jgi:hypothetical protein
MINLLVRRLIKIERLILGDGTREMGSFMKTGAWGGRKEYR